jgi:predicted DCC family thiol-disulfide oxidoreductase YuxK
MKLPGLISVLDMDEKLIIYFDGHCGLCNGVVDLLLQIDKRKSLKFSALQSDYARKHLNPIYTQNLETLVVGRGLQVWTKSQGFFQIISEIGGLWKALLIFKFLPLKFLNWIYDIVAKNRMSIFGRNPSCRIPTQEERSQFLE